MNYLSVDKVSKSFGDRLILDQVNFGLGKGEKTALVGINGSGKTTLLNVINEIIPPDHGDVSFRKDIRVAYLDQNPKFDGFKTVLDYILGGKDPKLQIIANYQHLMSSPNDQSSQDHMTNVLSQMDEYNLWDLESQIKQILGKLGIHDLSLNVDNLSGGQKKRVALARILIEKPDMMILDEPTNHLDLDTIEWLEQYISAQAVTLLLVTHDRYFLDATCNQILEIDQGKTHIYKGDYAYFLENKAERESAEKADVDKAKNLLKKELEWMRRQPKARGTKAKYRVDAFHDLKQKAQSKTSQKNVEMDFDISRVGKKILELEKVSKKYGQKELFSDFSYIFKKGDRIGIVGKNGSGKSTLLNVIMNKISPDKGTVTYGQNTKFGYYRQEELQYKPEQKVIDIIKDIAEFIEMKNGNQLSASQLLQKFAFPPNQQYDFVDKLSGGEKRRLQLLKVLIGNPNFLILDEPTNDLDLMTLNTLEDYLDNFSGCILMVSHDRYFMDRITDHIFAFEENGKIRQFPGNFTDYRKVTEEEKLVEQKISTQEEIKKQKSPKDNKLTYAEKREMEALEKEIKKLEEEKKELIEKLNIGTDDHETLASWSSRIGALNDDLDALEMRWLELSEKD